MSGTVKNQKQENLSTHNLQDILTKSINQAKQKAYLLDQLSTQKSIDKSFPSYDKINQKQGHGENRARKQTGAFVGAMKTLQNKISQLTADNHRYKNQLQKLRKISTLDMKAQTRQFYKQKHVWQEEKKFLQSNISKQKSYIKELEERIVLLVSQNQAIKQKMLQNQFQRGSNQQKHLPNLHQKIKQLQQRQQSLKQLQEQAFLTAMKLNNSVTQNIQNQKQLENQITRLTQKNSQYQNQLKSLKSELQEEKIRIKVLLKAIPSNCDKENLMIQPEATTKARHVPLKNRKKSNISQNHTTYKNADVALSAQNRSLLQKNEEIYFELKKSYEKNRFLLRDLKQWKAKYHQLKKLTDEITELISKTPHNFQSTFKNVIARVRKLQGTYLENLRSKSKSTRVLSNGVDRSPTKSRNRLKPLKMSDLNTSGLTSRSRSRSNSKKMKNFTLSSQKKSRSKTFIQKPPIVEQIKNLQKRIKQMKKQYMSIVNCTAEQEEQDKIGLLSEVVNKLQLFQAQKQILLNKQMKKQQICIIEEI